MMANNKKAPSADNTITPRLLDGNRVTMSVLPGYTFCRGYGFHGMAEYRGAKYEVYGADCGADCVCDAVAILANAELLDAISVLEHAGMLPRGNEDD